MEHNKWLESNEDLEKIDFNDKYYLQALTKELANYIKNVPVPMVTSWHTETLSINIAIGQELRNRFKVSSDIAYKDFVTLVELWARSYYPQYEFSYTAQEEYSDQEYLDMVKNEKILLDDALMRKKEVLRKEKGIIERIYMREDTFLFNLDGQKSLRISGVQGKEILPLSRFLQEIRKKSSDEEIREYIFNYSVEKKRLINKKQKEEISYSGFMMRNFFDINSPLLKEFKLEQIEARTWEWGKYRIYFESNLLEHDCINLARENEIEVNRCM